MLIAKDLGICDCHTMVLGGMRQHFLISGMRTCKMHDLSIECLAEISRLPVTAFANAMNLYFSDQ